MVSLMAPLIAPSDLAAMPTAPASAPPVVVDVRWRPGGASGRADHDRAHLPGAVHLDLDAELSDPPGAAGRHPLPAPRRLQAALRGAGVDDTSLVVAYDDSDGTIAARLWWLLRWAGLPADRVAVLDGGYAGWIASGLPTTADPARPTPGAVTVRAGAMPVVDADGAAALGRSGVLLDARAAERYRGEVEPFDPRAGHIPGAVNAPATELSDPEGRWLPPPVLAERFAALGVAGAPAVGAYCGSGVTAAALVLAVEYAGIRPPEDPVALYVGSWSNWSADPARPASTGDRP